jgi:very-long-chain enoyl-CoA reductase
MHVTQLNLFVNLTFDPLPTGKYKIPEGGLFGLVTCPHYLFEVLGFWGIAIVSRNLLPLTCALNTTCFLAGQASATTRWYVGKFGEKWPKERKHMIPFMY